MGAQLPGLRYLLGMSADLLNLETPRLLIRELDLDDILPIHQMNSQPQVAAFNTIGIPKSLDQTAHMLEPLIAEQSAPQRMAIGWSIRLRDDDAFVGEIGLNMAPPKYRMAEVHYSLHPDFWGNGYASEALKAIIDCCFTTLKLHRVEAGVATANTRSVALLEKVGMLREGLKRQILPIRGEWQDNYHYAILDVDWQQ